MVPGISLALHTRARSTVTALDGAREKGMSKTTYLSAQLRESAPYLQDAGWRQTADLLLAAADEIETLRAQQATEGAVEVARAKAIRLGRAWS